MLVFNPNRNCVEDIVPLSQGSRHVFDVVVVAGKLLCVHPVDHYRVYKITSHPQEYIDYYRALGHQVNILNGQVSAYKRSGSWRVEKLPPMNEAMADLAVFRESRSASLAGDQMREHLVMPP